MKHLVSMILIAAVIFALAFPVAKPAAAPRPQPQSSTSATAAAVRHEEIHDAIASLRIARDYLQHAAHDFGGHREEAVRKVDESLTQLQLCLGYDR